MQQNPLFQKLDDFIRKYYKNLLIKGLILFIGLIAATFFLVVVLEHFGHYGTTTRTMLFYFFLLSTGLLAWKFLYIPVSGMLRLGNTLSHAEAARIIGDHFAHINDKLINTLQLQQRADNNPLLVAAIEQKTKALASIPFSDAIDLGKNKKYVPIGITPFVLLLFAYLLMPDMIKEAPNRILRHNTFFPTPAPFSFYLLNDSLITTQQKDFEVRVKVKGSKLPDEVKLQVDGNLFLMQRIDKVTYAYTFRNVRQDVNFRFVGNEFPSGPYTLRVMNKPSLQQWVLKLTYPAYLRKPAETHTNPGDIIVPYGTVANWSITAAYASDVAFLFGNQTTLADQTSAGKFMLQKKLTQQVPYGIVMRNIQNGLSDSMGYQINIIDDEYPRIDVAERLDSLGNKVYYFAGQVSDDYGITRLEFNYKYLKAANANKLAQANRTTLAVPGGEKQHRFYHQIDLNQIEVEPGDEVEFYFEVWDNDGVRGAKSSRSKVLVHKMPTVTELIEKRDRAAEELMKEMENALREAQKLQKELKSLDRKMADKKELTWDEKKKLEELLQRQKQLEQKMEQIKQQQQQNVKQEQEFNQLSDEIMQKQMQIDKLFNELLTDELKQLIKQTQQMLNMQNKDLIKREMEKLQLSNKDVEKELDRMLEQFKELEVEKKLDEAINKLDELSDKQKQLADKTNELQQDKKLSKEDKNKQLEELKKDQQELNKEFDEWQQKNEELKKQNNELETPKELEDTKQDENDIEQNMDQSQEDLQNNKPEKASSKQQKASEQMKQMSNKMKQKRQEQQDEQDELDAEALREILENVIQLSKDQESLMEQMNSINGYNPQFVEAGKQQKAISDNARIIEDSLLALSKRVPQISSFVNKEVSKLKDNLDKSVNAYSQRQFPEIRVRQQYAMTSANNLGVMLSEILQQMQAEMNAKGSQDGQGKPGKGKGQGGNKPKKSMGDLRKMQDELNKQLREGLNKQQQQGGSQDGPGTKEFARMAAQQQAIRQMMQQMLNQMGTKEKEGLGGQQQVQEMQKLMEQTEKELFNKKLSSEMIQRQQEIMSRMLESEKAEKQREQDQKRQGEQAKEKQQNPPPDFSPFFKQKQKETELIQSIPAELKPYFKERVRTYFNTISVE